MDSKENSRSPTPTEPKPPPTDHHIRANRNAAHLQRWGRHQSSDCRHTIGLTPTVNQSIAYFIRWIIVGAIGLIYKS